MLKQINIRNSVIAILCITIIFLAIGFIVLSIELENKNSQKFDISFINIEKVSSLKGGALEPVGDLKIESNGKVLDMNFTLNSVHDELIYKATIKNKGTMPASITKLIETPEYSDRFSKSIRPITISYTDIEGKILDAGETTEIKILVDYQPDDINKKHDISLKLGIISESK